MQSLNGITRTRTTALCGPDDNIRFLGRNDTESGLGFNHERRTASLRAANQGLQQNASPATSQPSVETRELVPRPFNHWNIFAALLMCNLSFRVFFAISLAGAWPSPSGINVGYVIGVILSLVVAASICVDIAGRLFKRVEERKDRTRPNGAAN